MKIPVPRKTKRSKQRSKKPVADEDNFDDEESQHGVAASPVSGAPARRVQASQE